MAQTKQTMQTVLNDLIREGRKLGLLIEDINRFDTRAGKLLNEYMYGRISQKKMLTEAGIGDRIEKSLGRAGQFANNVTGQAAGAAARAGTRTMGPAMSANVADKFGKASNAANIVKQKIAQLAQLAQNSKPIADFDKWVANFQKQVVDKAPKLANTVTQYAAWAEKHPNTQKLVIAILTAALSFATGPAGGAVAALLLRSSNGLLKGEKASTAIGKAVVASTTGWLAGIAIKDIAHMIGDHLLPELQELHSGKFINNTIHVEQYADGNSGTLFVKGIVDAESFQKLNLAMNSYEAAIDQMHQELTNGGVQAATEMKVATSFNTWSQVAHDVLDPHGAVQKHVGELLLHDQKALAELNASAETFNKFSEAMSAAVQGAISSGVIPKPNTQNDGTKNATSTRNKTMSGTNNSGQGTNNQSSTGNEHRIYTDSQLHDLFTDITGKLMDSGHITVGDSPLTNKIRNFLGVGGDQNNQNHQSYGGNHTNYASQQQTRVDPSKTAVDPRTLKAGLNYFKIDPKVSEQVMDIAKANPNTSIIHFIDLVNQAGIKGEGLMTAIMNAHR